MRRTAAISATRSARIRSTTTITRRARRSGTRSPCRCSRRRTGAARACIRAAISKASCAPPRKTNGSRRTASSTGRTSTPTTAASCSASSSTISSRARTPAGASSRACSCRCAIRARRSSSAHENEWPIARTQVDEALSRTPADFSLAETSLTGEARVTFDALGDGVTFLTPPLDSRDRDHRPGRGEAVRVVIDHATPTCSWSCACSPPDMKEVVFLGAIDPHTPIAQGWLRASHRKLDPKLTTALPALSHPRREAAADARRAGRARHRAVADLDRGAGRLSRRAHRARQGLRIRRRHRRRGSRTSRTS